MPGKIRVLFFPFDLFGSSGTAAGAQLLADAFREMLDDNRREKVPTRARAYSGKIIHQEWSFDTLRHYQQWRRHGRFAARQTWQHKDFLLWVSGNHLATLPIYEELGRRKETTLVLQLDAHLDIYNLSDCTTELSHGNFLVHAETALPQIINVGHRELLLRPDYIRKFYQETFSAAELAIDPEPALTAITKAAASAASVFLDLDCDVFDPAFFPAQAHPLPFGLSPQLVLRILEAAWSDRLIGLAVSEFDPARDQDDRSLATLIWLIEYVLLKRYETAQ